MRNLSQVRNKYSISLKQTFYLLFVYIRAGRGFMGCRLSTQTLHNYTDRGIYTMEDTQVHPQRTKNGIDDVGTTLSARSTIDMPHTIPFLMAPKLIFLPIFFFFIHNFTFFRFAFRFAKSEKKSRHPLDLWANGGVFFVHTFISFYFFFVQKGSRHELLNRVVMNFLCTQSVRAV